MDDQSYYEEYYYDESKDDGDDYSRKPVPILLSIILVITYIIGGAFLFQMWEGWSFLDRSGTLRIAFFLNIEILFQLLLLLHNPDNHWFWRLDTRSEEC